MNSPQLESPLPSIRFIIISSIISLSLLTTGLVYAWCSPCSGYEPNIYSSTPSLFWFGLGICYLVGIALTLLASFKYKTPRFVPLLGYIQIILASISLMSLHVIRGYKLLNISGDTGTHIGRLNLILTSGNLPNTYYPNIYSEPALLSLVSGISSDTVLQLFPILSLLMFTVWICIISKHVFVNKGEVYFSRVITLIIPCGSAIVVSSYSLLYGGMTISNMVLLPLFIYLVILNLKGNDLGFVPLALVGLSTVFYHPHVAIMILAILAVSLFISIIHKIKNMNISTSSILKLCISFVITIIGFFIHQWNFFSETIIVGINKVIGIFFNRENLATHLAENTPIMNDVTDIGPATLNQGVELDIISNLIAYIGDILGFSIIRTGVEAGYSLDTIFQVSGINIFIYGMLCIAGFIFLWKYMRDERYYYLKFVYILAIAMFPLILVSIIMGDSSGGWGRFKQPIYIAALLSCGFVLYRLYLKITESGVKNTTIRLCSIFLILALVCGMSVYTFHPSPYTLEGGYQTTQAELTGTETLLPLIEYDYTSTTGVHFRGMQRYVTAHYNHLSLPNRDDTAYDAGLPYHFGYDTGSSSLSENIRDGEEYVIVTERDFEYYQTYFPQMIQYLYESKDYDHLSVDVAFHYVYDNGGFSTYKLYSTL